MQENRIKELEGPIFIFGAGGFIGINLLNLLLEERKDVFGISHDYINNWRFIANKIPFSHLLNCDITEIVQVEELVKIYKPKTIFNLAAYGAYSKQKEYNKIYSTNFNSTVIILETLKKYGFTSYVHAGSSSEYGLNSSAPSEDAELLPNTHYSVSKLSAYYLLKYYGKIEKLPVTHLRLYSAYGAWEEPDRLIPVLISSARNNFLPPLVHPDISRDFIFISDVCSAFVLSAFELQKGKNYGEVFNIGTGSKTTIRELVEMVCKKLSVVKIANFKSMPDRNWDLTNWYSNPRQFMDKTGWIPRVSLEKGIELTIQWQENVNFDNALWNWTKRK